MPRTFSELVNYLATQEMLSLERKVKLLEQLDQDDNTPRLQTTLSSLSFNSTTSTK
jgi:hypothetical protein